MKKIRRQTTYKRRTDDPLFSRWAQIRYLMLNPNQPRYPLYCDLECRGLDSFTVFRDFVLTEIGDLPDPSYKLSRRDHNIGYIEGNIQWAEDQRQIGAGQRTVRRYRIGNVELCLAEWARRYDIRSDTLKSRLKRGWNFKMALETRPRGYDHGRA